MTKRKEIDINFFRPMVNLGALVVLAICCLIGYQIICWRCSDQVTQLNQQASELRKSLNRFALLKVKMNHLGAQKQERDAKLAELPPRVVVEGGVHLNRLVTQQLKQAGLLIDRVSTSQSSLQLTGECLSVSVAGSFKQTCRLLSQIEPLPANVRIEELTITADKDRPVYQLRISFGLENASRTKVNREQI